MKRLIGQTLLMLLVSLPLSAQTEGTVDLLKNSSLTISGYTNIVPFKFIQNGEKLTRRNMTIATIHSYNKMVLSETQLSVEIDKFTSSNKMALCNFKKLLKSDTYPTVQIHFNPIEMQPDTEKGQCYKSNVIANITITGVTRQYSIPILTNCEGDLFIVDGMKKMSIRDFGLTPPVQMMGLIKVSEWIDINFHIICKIRTENTAKL
jgi:hypothetical protein